MAPKEPGKVVDIRQVLAEGKTAPDPYTRDKYRQIKRSNANLTAAQIQKKIASLTTPEALAKGVDPRRIATLQGILMNRSLGQMSSSDRARFAQARELRAAGKQVPAELQAILKALKADRAASYVKTGNDYLQTGYKKAPAAATHDTASTDPVTETTPPANGNIDPGFWQPNKLPNSKFLDPATAAKLAASGVKRKSYILAQLQNEMSPMGQLKGQIGNAVAGMRPPRPRPQRPRPLPGGRQLLGPFPAPQRPVLRPQRPRPFPNPGPFKPTPR